MVCTNKQLVGLTWTAGDTEHFVINRLDPDRVPIDMTGMTTTMSLRRKVTDASPAITVDGIITVSEGKIDFAATGTQTRALVNGRRNAKYVFDCQVTDGVNVTTIVGGTIDVTLDVTR
ncbi:hypothetical protein VPDG_00116 [Vibrio phage henriette 12B8]|uniref:hypothetical protein n=1 Tax=Vibrio phage henriette 12B8 TaxID=573174 RepID=UPI0002C08B8F|nr:hypothetical protein VPDG_00116 [Vibrio phage henriette 12B8]AGG58277.1 hypothetical protein VPDG_00116 [Vibrio phage henriette 12B8]